MLQVLTTGLRKEKSRNIRASRHQPQQSGNYNMGNSLTGREVGLWRCDSQGETLIETFCFSKFDYNIFPEFLPILGKRKVLTGLVSPILKLGQKVIGISDFIGLKFTCCTEGIEIGQFFFFKYLLSSI